MVVLGEHIARGPALVLSRQMGCGSMMVCLCRGKVVCRLIRNALEYATVLVFGPLSIKQQ